MIQCSKVIFFLLLLVRTQPKSINENCGNQNFNGNLVRESNSHPLSFSKFISTSEDNEQWKTLISTEVNELVKKFLQDAESNSSCLIQNVPHEMQYEIFNGKSSFRSLTSQQLILCQKLHTKSKLLLVFYFLLKQNLDLAHEIILGVNTQNFQEAEYAASHPGQTSWSDDHPLSTLDDILHCIIHRFEGCNRSKEGSGTYSGYENAKFWLVGGDKKLSTNDEHDLWTFMKEYVFKNDETRKKFGCLGLVVPEKHDDDDVDSHDGKINRREHSVIASGGARRTVSVGSGKWDEFRFIDLCALRHDVTIGTGSNNQVEKVKNSFEDGCRKMGLQWHDGYNELIDHLQLVQLQFLIKLALK